MKLALRLPDAYLGDLLDEAPYLAASVPAVEVGPDAGLQVFRLADVERGAVLVDEVVDAGRVRHPACQVLLLGFDAAPSPADSERFSDALYACGALGASAASEHLRRRRSVGEGPVVRRLAHAEVADERAQTVAFETGHQAAGELQGVEDLVGELDSHLLRP